MDVLSFLPLTISWLGLFGGEASKNCCAMLCRNVPRDATKSQGPTTTWKNIRCMYVISNLEYTNGCTFVSFSWQTSGPYSTIAAPLMSQGQPSFQLGFTSQPASKTRACSGCNGPVASRSRSITWGQVLIRVKRNLTCVKVSHKALKIFKHTTSTMNEGKSNTSGWPSNYSEL